MDDTPYYKNQSPSDLETIDILYRYPGDPETYTGKLVILPPAYRWLLDIDILGDELPPEWKEFDDSIFHYVDTAVGEELRYLIASRESRIDEYNAYDFYIVEYTRQLGPDCSMTLYAGS